jgi:hypothetical protein
MHFGHLPNSGDDVFTQLRQLAASPDHLVAARSTMLLQLLDHLQSSRSSWQAHAILVLNELWISVTDPYRNVRVRVDWNDHGKMRDDLPVMHFRIETKPEESTLTREARAFTLAEAEQAIIELLAGP